MRGDGCFKQPSPRRRVSTTESLTFGCQGDTAGPGRICPHGRIFGCFTADRRGLRSLEEVGEDNICFETDYPHTDTTWPFVREEVERMAATLSDDQRYKILRGNAIRMLDLDRV